MSWLAKYVIVLIWAVTPASSATGAAKMAEMWL